MKQFLHALGRAGGLCDCGDIEDVSRFPWGTPPQAGLSSVNSWRMILRLTAPPCDPMPTLGGPAQFPQPHNSIWNACTAMDRPGIHFYSSVTIRRSFCLVRMEQTCNETPRVSLSSATRATIPHLLSVTTASRHA